MKEELDPNKKTILVVDDEKPIIDILVYNLQKEGYNTLEATDGEMGLNMALEKKPNLILLDVMQKSKTIFKYSNINAICKRWGNR